MGLAQDIVIVNQFTMRGSDGRGTRGATPGAYVTRYMARPGATEPLAPTRRLDLEDFIERYMARDSATEQASDPRDAAARVRGADGSPPAGVAFGPDTVSMSSEAVRRRSREIQDAFDHGKTVLKTVISFDTDYLIENGIVPDHFTPRRKGDWRGHVDQLKLRRAIQNGMRRVSSAYGDLSWIGVIQVDTLHVHCHLAAVDLGDGRLRSDGAQDGRLTATMMRDIRRGIDTELDRAQAVRQLSADAGFDRQWARNVVKRYATSRMLDASGPQFLLACLPTDSRRWREGSHARDMRKANELCRQWVMGVLEEDGEVLPRVRGSVAAYADARQEREGLSRQERDKVAERAEERVIGSCVNAVYQVLRQIPAERRTRETDTLDLMSMDLPAMASVARGDPALEFGVRFRGYASRLDLHRERRQRFHDLAVEWEGSLAQGHVAEDSRAMYDFFLEEEDYNAALMRKYLHFLHFAPQESAYGDQWRQVLQDRDRARAFRAMADDEAMADMSPDDAETYGRRRYGRQGGHVVAESHAAAEARADNAEADYQDSLALLQFVLEGYGWAVFEDEDGELTIDRDDEDDFEDVKAYDIHHLGYDFPFGADVSEANERHFEDATARREQACAAARAYLTATGQSLPELDESEEDARLMRRVADELAQTHEVRSLRQDGIERRRVRVTSLDNDPSDEMRRAVHEAATDSIEL